MADDEKKVVTLGLPAEPEQPAAPEQPDNADAFQVPPPAAPMPGMAGNPPIPVGSMVSSKTGYTEEELATLKTVPGWKEGDPVPSNLAEILEQVKAGVADETNPDRLRPPVDPSTPPLQVPQPVDVGSLSPDQQAKVLGHIDQAKAATEQREAQAAASIDGAGPGVNEALLGQGVRTVDLEDDTGDEHYAGTDVPQGDPGEGLPKEPPRSRTGAGERVITNCPHCHWDLRQPDIPDPDKADKRRYLEAALGMKPFQKVYELLGGGLTVIFRELTPVEVDLCFKQAHADRLNGKFTTTQDFFEQLQRYRLVLQLKLVQTDEIQQNCPETVEAWAGQRPLFDSKGTILPTIYEQIYGTVIKTETMNRLLGTTLTRFNRLITKMEGNAENKNFWSATEPEPS